MIWCQNIHNYHDFYIKNFYEYLSDHESNIHVFVKFMITVIVGCGLTKIIRSSVNVAKPKVK